MALLITLCWARANFDVLCVALSALVPLSDFLPLSDFPASANRFPSNCAHNLESVSESFQLPSMAPRKCLEVYSTRLLRCVCRVLRCRCRRSLLVQSTVICSLTPTAGARPSEAIRTATRQGSPRYELEARSTACKNASREVLDT